MPGRLPEPLVRRPMPVSWPTPPPGKRWLQPPPHHTATAPGQSAVHQT